MPLRVKTTTYIKYHKLTLEEKRELRDMFEQLVAGYVEQAHGPRKIININIAVAKNQNTSIQMDPEVLQKENQILKEEKRKLKEIVKFYEEELERARKDIAELQKRLRVEREARARLVGYIRYILAHAGNDVLREELQKILEKEVG